MSFVSRCVPDAEEEQPSISVLPPYDVAKQKFRMRPPVPRAPDGMLTRICEDGAYFCTRCICYYFEPRTCERCAGPLKWIPPIFSKPR